MGLWIGTFVLFSTDPVARHDAEELVTGVGESTLKNSTQLTPDNLAHHCNNVECLPAPRKSITALYTVELVRVMHMACDNGQSDWVGTSTFCFAADK